MTASEIARLIIRIEETVNPDSEYYGKLVKWWEQDRELWHYGIGLSNTHFFNIGTIEAKELQILKRHDIIEHDIIEHRNLDIRGVPGIYSPFESDEIIERLKYSLRWLNDLPENSSKKKINGKALAFLIFTDDEAGTDKDSEPIDIDFASYLKQQSPQLKHNKIRDFFEKGKNWVYIFLGIFGFLIVVAIALIGEFGSDKPGIKGLLSVLLFPLSIFLVIIISNWISNFKWSGFQKKSFWDWLQLLIVPLMLAFGAFYLNYASETRDKQIAEERKQQELLKDYFSKMQTLIIEANKLSKSQWEPLEHFANEKLPGQFQPIAQALTLAVLDELDGLRKGKVITYLAESGFITKETFTINLNGANLQKLELKGVSLNSVIINNADMTGAKLTKVQFTDSDLGASNFSQANLDGVNFSSAILQGSNFYDANLKNIEISKPSKDLSGTDFEDACFSVHPKIESLDNPNHEYLTSKKIKDLEKQKIIKYVAPDKKCEKPEPKDMKQDNDL